MAITTAATERDYYTVAEAAKLLSVSPSTIWRWIRAERLPAIRVGPRTIRIRKNDLDALLRPAAPVPPQRRRVYTLEEARAMLGQRPSEEESAQRRDWAERALANRDKRSISPWTTADLVQMARERVADPDEWWRERYGR